MKIFIFDLGKTLIDAHDIIEVLSKEIDEKNYKKYYGFLKKRFDHYKKLETFFSVKEILSKICVECSQKFGCKDISSIAGKLYEKNYIEDAKLYKNVEKILKFLKAEKKLIYALTDADKDIVIKELKNLKIYEYFDRIITSEDTKSYKPSEKIVTFVKQNLEIEFSSSIFIGDSNDDKEIAKKLGIKFFKIKNGNLEGFFELIKSK